MDEASQPTAAAAAQRQQPAQQQQQQQQLHHIDTFLEEIERKQLEMDTKLQDIQNEQRELSESVRSRLDAIGGMVAMVIHGQGQTDASSVPTWRNTVQAEGPAEADPAEAQALVAQAVATAETLVAQADIVSAAMHATSGAGADRDHALSADETDSLDSALRGFAYEP